MMPGIVCSLMQYVVLYISFEFEEKSTLYFSKYEGLDGYMYELLGLSTSKKASDYCSDKKQSK